ncbi:MAG TPA: hypothetical protein VFC43_07690 [Methanoregula sp.]|nr:hypothetical protein [Methanoregula sp.]
MKIKPGPFPYPFIPHFSRLPECFGELRSLKMQTSFPENNSYYQRPYDPLLSKILVISRLKEWQWKLITPKSVFAGFPADCALITTLKVQAGAGDVKPNPGWAPVARLSRVP